ncbi:discoidin domain-containing protein [Cellulomonas sp. URHD0024]|uniref:galactose-binding domain-containing protein n=1 Tax=Cellulomonas sp. URHD0024 TaxID=1302620 RepID=UPI000408A776|nr:discoidin domain-containing protein [Cellulomonas sp. URHD0024]
MRTIAGSRRAPSSHKLATTVVTALVGTAVVAGGWQAVAAPVQNPAVVPVGSGSYASAPPAALDAAGHDVSATVDRPLYIDGSQSGKPVPTNSWWTDLVVSKYSGSLWADPLVLSNSSAGTKVFLPTSWNADGSARVLDQEIEVQGAVTPTPGPSDVVMADFDTALPTGWTATGTAFTGTTAGSATGQSPVAGYLGKGLLNSFTSSSGDGATGTLTSPTFTVDHNTIAFLVGGGKHPDQTGVQLVVDGQVVRTATGADSEQLAWVTWNVADLRGRAATIKVVDSLAAGWGHVLVDQVVRTDDTANLSERFSTQFIAADAKALRWGEWNVSWRMASAAGAAKMDVTAARGIPYAWFEFTQMNPRIVLQPGATLTGLSGQPLTLPATVSAVQVTQGGRSFGIHLPDGSVVDRTGNVLALTLSKPYLVVSAVPASGATLADLQAHAFAIPRDTKMTYAYDPTAGEVRQTWDVTTDLLQGTDHSTIQGWLPHHYVDAKQALAFTGYGYDAPRGRMKMTVGTGGWVLRYPFTGITPLAPAPTDAAAVAQVKKYVADYSKKTTYGGDTYWGGKDVLQLAQYMAMAKQVGATDSYNALKATLKTALDDWFTYTPGEKEHFFARYPTWKALIGFGDSYGSFEFTDNHFHYGYFTLAAALLAMDDPTWGQQYGPMATLVAKQYANSDRSSTDFPYLRTFDTWEGHSYAGGFSSPGGNNQESSSEAIQSWVGIFMLGAALGDDQMQATGAMGYVTERASVQEYWLDTPGDSPTTGNAGVTNHPAAYQHGTTGILFDSGQAFATYFSGDPAWIYGIQWMPTGPYFGYLGWDRAFGRELLAKMFDERPTVLGAYTAGDNGANLARAAKRWYGVGTDWGANVTVDKAGAVTAMQDAVRNAYLHNPTYVSARTAANPLYDTAKATLRFTVAADGSLVFPTDVWNPAALPAGWTPPTPPAATPDADPKTWATGWGVFQYLSTAFTPDPAALKRLYAYEVRTYTPGRDTTQAADVYSRMGDALGNVVLGYVAQADPAMYADVIAELARRGDPVATGVSMAGSVFYNAQSNLSLGQEVVNRHVAAPTSQVYRNGTTYTYVVFNPTDQQKSYAVYDGTTQIGSIAVPARTLVRSGLDGTLARIVVSASPAAKTVPVGQSVQLTATGYDQYGAVVPLTGTTWSVSGGGTITSAGKFTATTNADPVVVTAAVGSVQATLQLRVGAAPALAGITVSPAFARVTQGATAAFTAAGVDQYGDPFALTGAQWAAGGRGTVSASGVLTATTLGAGTLTVTVGGVRGTAVVDVTAAPADVAHGKTATASSGTASAALAVDGSATTRWESSFADEQWLQVDLGARYELSSVTIDWETAAAASYDVQVADSATGPFRTIRSVTKVDASDDTLAVAGSGRYLRIAGHTRLTGYGFSIFELNARGVLAGDAVTPTTVLVSPGTAAVRLGGSVALQAYAFDAAGNGGPVAATWAVSGGGQVDSAGRYTAGSTATTATVTATVAGVKGTSTISVGGSTTPTDPTGPTDPGTVVDLAKGKPATASSTLGQASPALAVDGDAGTRWESTFADNQWIQVDLGVTATLSEVQIDWEAAAAGKFSVQVSSSPTGPWQTLATVTNSDATPDKVPVAGSGRYVRIDAPTRLTQYGVSIFSLRVLGSTSTTTTPQATDVARGKTATASSVLGANTAAAAVDGDAGTRWESAHADGQWVQVDLGARYALSSVELDWEAAAAGRFTVQVSDSATGPWQSLATVTKTAATPDKVTVSGTGRYVRIDAPTRLTQWGVSLWSLRVLGTPA